MTQPKRRRDDEPTSNGPRPLNERLAELRETAKRDPSFLYLLPSSMEPPRRKSRKKPVLIVAAAGAVLAIGAVVVLAMGGGGGGSNGSPTPDGSKPSSNSVAVPPLTNDSPTPTPTPTHAIPTPTPRSADDTVHEGAIPVPAATLAPPENPRLVTPLNTKARVLDRFGSPRGDGYIHGGTDLAPASGSNAFDVYSACDGTVAGIDHSGTYGDFLVVDCGGGWKTIYANLAEITAPSRQGVAAGATKLGAALGSVHFEVRFTDSNIDPERYINFAAGPLPPTPTPAPSPSPTATATSVPPSNGGSGGGSTPGNDPSPAPTSTPLPPTATPTPLPPTATPTATPTSTPTPRPPRRTATPPPVIK